MTPCPACLDDAPEVFCTLRQLPVHGTAVCQTRDAALAMPRADQVLAVCHRCGLVFNSEFVPELLDYSAHHEESQAHSPTFRAYAEDLAQQWVTRYELQDQLVVEVGCGKGDFLRLLAQAGVGRAHGVDPGLDLARLPSTGEVTGDVARFAPSELSRSATALVCRHTFEHVPDVLPFLELLQQGVSERCRAFLVEVPDLTRVLDEAAFWDLQYEHCSSFTATSLHALFTRAGMQVLDLRLTYGGQYLVVEADPVPGRREALAMEVEPVAEVVARCRRFAGEVDRRLSSWRDWLQRCASAGEEVVVWGGGSKGSAFLASLPDSRVRRVVDINPGLQGSWMGGVGLPIVGPAALVDDQPHKVLLMNGIYTAEVRGMLDDLGLHGVEVVAV